MGNEILNAVGLYLLLCCVLPFVIMSVVAIWTLRYGRAYLTPNFADMQADFVKLKAKHPRESDADLAQRIINKQARRSGVVGALTSVGGLFILPFGLAIDMYSSARIQNTMLQFLAWVYEPPAQSDSIELVDALRLQASGTAQTLAVASGQRLSRVIYRRIMVQVAEKSFAKIVPIIGLGIGYAVNYFATQSMGKAVRYYYENKPVRLNR